eukprot:g3933.t1
MQRPGPRTTAGRGFAAKFYDILSQESSDIIRWTDSGQAFQVVDYNRFSEEILLKYFRHNKFSSFRRQLNLYGYRKVIKGPDAGAYMHPSFQRDRPDLLGEVKKGKVPHYDMHGVNEIHGQHFRHHPPGAKNKENTERAKTPAQLSPVPKPKSSPIPPDVHGGEGYRTPHGAGAPMPTPHMTPGTRAAVAMSNMSLSPMPHPATANNNNTWAHPQNPGQQGMEELTLTAAWGGGGAGAHDGGGGGADSSKGKGAASEKPGGGGSGGGASTASSGAGVPMAYWEKARKRRTMSAQLVFPVQPPKNTENIDQPDPSLCDVMDVICQCMEVRNSSEESHQSQLSALSACSFNSESLRRSSISDLLNCMSWESALRGSGFLRGSLAGALDAAMMDGEQGGRASGAGGGSNGAGGGDNADNQPPLPPMFGQQASFDPTRDPSGANSDLVPGMMQPAVIAPSPVTSATPEHGGDHGEEQQQLHQKQASRPSFDPHRESSINLATGMRSTGQASSGVTGQGGAAGGANTAAGGNAGAAAGGSGAHPSGVSRESSRGSTAARIFNSVPVRTPTPGAAAAGDASGYWGANGARESGGDSGATAPDGSAAQWVTPSTQQQASASASASAASTAVTTTSSTWGMPHQPQGPRGQDVLGGLGDAQVVTSPPSSSATSSPSAQARGAQVFSRPSLGRMGSLQWLTEPAASRRPTMNETHEVNRLLANPEHFSTWTRVAEDPDTMYLAKSIGDFLG